MKRVASALLCLMLLVGISTSQQTPSSILSAGAAFQALSPKELEISQSALLSLLVYGVVVSPSSVLSNGAAFYALSDKDLLVAQTYLLSQVPTNSGAGSITNFGGSATNLTQRFTATTTNYLDTGTVYWVWNNNLPLFSANAAGAYVFYNGIIGDGSGLTNLTPSNVQGAITNGNKSAFTMGNAITLTNYNNNTLTISNQDGTFKGSITASRPGSGIGIYGYNSSGIFLPVIDAYLGQINVTNNSPLFVWGANGTDLVTVSNGMVAANNGIQSPYWIGFLNSRTNTWTTNTIFPLGVTNLVPVLSANTSCGITGLDITGSVNNNDTMYGSMNIQTVNGNVTFTNHANFKTSDFLTSRVITNGNTLKITIEWQKGLCTNMYLVQCH